ncbi:MAG: hypothetical protein IKT78_00085, partial [Ruminiclostridium sp.]|nr:hypothetical protein [Ruminiclostridium sp.]
MQSLKIKAILRYLVLIFTIIPVVIVGIIGFFSVTGFANSTVEQYAKSIATAHSDAIDQVIGQYERDAHILSLRQDIYDMASSSASEESIGLIKNTFDTIINRQENDVLN